MNSLVLGRLEKVDLRAYWRNEAQDFTPWLVHEENIRLLGDAIGLELVVESVEKTVGPFFADILCKDTGRESWVIIENQLETTDHSHLGQLLTYAAGLEARTVIWVSARFTDEHRAALDWLNEATGEAFNFFGVEIELWRIGDSVPAPKFNVVCQPNDWSKAVQASAMRAELTETRRTQLEFWTAFAEFMKGNSTVRCASPMAENWMSHALGLRGCHFNSVVSTYDSTTGKAGGELRVDVYLDGQDAKENFAKLNVVREEIEHALGEPLTWHSPPEARMARIYVRRPADLANRAEWGEYHSWLKEKLERFQSVFVPRIRALGVQSGPTEQQGA